jgi:hypothetical protein
MPKKAPVGYDGTEKGLKNFKKSIYDIEKTLERLEHRASTKDDCIFFCVFKRPGPQKWTTYQSSNVENVDPMIVRSV